jgi:hypothetical protein
MMRVAAIALVLATQPAVSHCRHHRCKCPDQERLELITATPVPPAWIMSDRWSAYVSAPTLNILPWDKEHADRTTTERH